MKFAQTLTFIAAISSTTAMTNAAIVHIHATGTVEFNVFNSGPFVGVTAGTPAVMDFDVDSDVFVNSPNYPTRGYPIIQSTFTVTAGSGTALLANPFPAGQTPF